jgi:hypothetical protein
MPATYEAIASTTLGSNTATVTFDSIAATWTDLVLVCTLKRTSGGEVVYVRFNNDTGSNYSSTQLYGTGSSAASTRQSSASNGISFGVSGPNEFSPHILHVMSYANTNVYKTALTAYAVASPVTNYQAVGREVGLWRSTSAITRIDVREVGAGISFATGSTFSLYGIKAA